LAILVSWRQAQEVGYEHLRRPRLAGVSRRTLIRSAFGGLGLAALSQAGDAAEEKGKRNAPIAAKDPLKITKLETLLVKRAGYS